jgi:hypothetical protein
LYVSLSRCKKSPWKYWATIFDHGAMTAELKDGEI